MTAILSGLGLILVGVIIARWPAKTASDMPTYVGAAVIAGGIMLTLVSVAMLLAAAQWAFG
jgi:uncharacterized membrane protein HdeD (DUF308 family)